MFDSELQLWKCTYVKMNHSSSNTPSSFLFRKPQGEIEHMLHFDLSLRHAWNQTWYLLTGIIHMAAWFQILGIPHVDHSQIGLVSDCASAGQSGLRRAALVITAAQGCLSDLSSSLHTLFTFWSATPSPIIPIQMDVYLDRGPEQDFIVISVEGDSENMTLGFNPAGKVLFSSLNREITSHKHSGGKKGFFLDMMKSVCT